MISQQVKQRRAVSATVRAFCQILAIGMLFHLAAPTQVGAWPWTICGDELLGIGPITKSDATLLGKTFKPTCNLNGTFRFNYIGGRVNTENSVIFAPSLALDLDVQLTNTERFHFLFRPFDHGVSGSPARPERATQWRPKAGLGQDSGSAHHLDFEPDRAWFEIQPFTWLSPQDLVPLDINIAGGRIPLSFHNNYWWNEDVLGFSISKNNIYFPPLQNLNVITYWAFDELNRFNEATVAGLGAFIDYRGYFFEATFAYAWDRTDRNDRFFAGISVTKQVGLTGAALRIMLNEDDGREDRADLGALFVIETETRLFSDSFYGGEIRLYANGFYSTENWAPVGGGNVARQGFLFQTDRSISIPALVNRGINSGGAAIGVIFNPEGTTTVTPEFGFLRDESKRSREGRNAAGNLEQIGLGLRVQGDLSRILSPLKTFPWHDADYERLRENRDSLLYGLQFRTTWYNIIPTTGESEHAFRIELLYDF